MRRLTWFHLLLLAFSLNLRSLLCAERRTQESRNVEEDDALFSRKKCTECFKTYCDKREKNENNGGNKRASCFYRLSPSLEQKKLGTQLDTKEVEQLLVEKLLKYWRIREKKLKAPRKLCSKLLKVEGTDVHGFFSTKFVKVVRSNEVDYEVHRVQLSDQNEGGKDLRLLACPCKIIKMDSDTDSDLPIGPPNYDVHDDEDSEPEVDEYHQPRLNRSSVDSINIWYGPKCSTDRLSDGDSTVTSPQNEEHTLPPAERAPTPKFAQTSKSRPSARKVTEIESPSHSSPDQETTPSSSKLKQRPSTPRFRRQRSGKQKDEDLSLTDFDPPLEFARPSRLPKPALSTNMSPFNESKHNVVEFSPSLRSRRTRSQESQFSDFKPTFTPERQSRGLDYSKVGIPPTFSRWIINNAEEVPTANICVGSKMYISKGVSGQKSFFLYAKNLENDTFNVIGHFRL